MSVKNRPFWAVFDPFFKTRILVLRGHFSVREARKNEPDWRDFLGGILTLQGTNLGAPPTAGIEGMARRGAALVIEC